MTAFFVLYSYLAALKPVILNGVKELSSIESKINL